MHSPNTSSGPSVTMRRPPYYNCIDPGSPPQAPSTKILQSLLYNFAHSSYLNNGSTPTENRDNRSIANNEQLRNNGSNSRIESERNRDPGNHVCPEYSRNRRPHHEMASPPRQHPYRQVTNQHQSSHLGYDTSQLHHTRCFQNPSSTVTSQNRTRDSTPGYPDNYLSPRHRSSSIGSAGSSFRDSRSPSHDSTTSHDSLSRCSPMSIGSSPSPSPPTPENNTSKLFGILKGASYSYPYSIQPTRNSHQSDSLNHSLTTQRRSSSTSNKSSSSTLTYKSDKYLNHNKEGIYRKSEVNTHELRTERTPIYGVKKRDISQCQEEPIDLSCKSKRKRTEGSPCTDSPQILARSLSWGSDCYSPSSSNDRSDSPESNAAPKKSILESILCGQHSVPEHRMRSDSMSSTRSRNGLIRDSQSPYQNYCVNNLVKNEPMPPESVPSSPFSHPESHVQASSPPTSMPPSPAISIGSQFGLTSPKPRCPWRQQVTLAKKNLFPVSARVSDWILKIVDFAKSLTEFASLPDSDRVNLVQQCWARLMLLLMAENNFHFAVTPIHEDSDDGRPPAISGIDPSEPTMDSVELVQNFIRKCQVLNLELEEYRCLRLVTLFHSGCTGLENADFVDKISSGARQKLQDHVEKSRPDDKLRYSNLLLCLHTLFGVNCGMVQTLFCKHLFKDRDLEEEMKNLVLKRGSFDDDSESEDMVTVSPKNKDNHNGPL